ncbi:hypothetical protein HRG_010423 [Hirsutella rhossiliensis]|uniref:BD-FAE-like domain-containing protein n=1 Tax=Hirsutella rhossiliensis TaxID=111463 RepID=A0A9P8MR97_9HYPO|nr:uncharacterized protein HRG_10423 [Hirsutella rhossiliensis]KAH0958736.1 hypothetical protein HRG_10423 [Hirsutella rhossiliensis]
MNLPTKLHFMIYCMALLGVLGQDPSVSDLGSKFTLVPFGKADQQLIAFLETSPKGQFWVVLIHGGAWQSGSGQDFVPAIRNMLGSSDFSDLRGFVTINYRLSGGQPPAQHPDHVMDAISGLNFFDKNIRNGTKYILLGQSAGGTMIFQMSMGEAALKAPPATGRQSAESQAQSCSDDPPPTAQAVNASQDMPKPEAMISLAGIHDLNGLVEEANDRFYDNFTEQAFGKDRGFWDQVSPAKFDGKYKDAWPGKSVVMLARSDQDELVFESQLTVMQKRLSTEGITPIVVGNLKGDHFKFETQVPPLIQQALSALRAQKQ